MTFRNLAHDEGCDKYIQEELRRARIPQANGSGRRSDVPAGIHGRLGQYKFSRFWYYWSVSGPVPLSVAKELYEDPVGRTDIRVAGHCAAPPPEESAHWFIPDGRQLLPLKEKAEWDRHMAKGGVMKDILQKGIVNYVFSDDPREFDAKAYIDSYHIDTEVGLRLFRDTICKHGLDKVTIKWFDMSGEHVG